MFGASSASNTHTLPSTSQYVEVICAVDGKNIIIIYRRESWNTYYPDSLLIIGILIIIPDDNQDTNVEAIVGFQGYSTYSRICGMFADKSGSTSLNANGASYDYMRLPKVEVPYYLLPSGSISKVSYAPLHFYWDSYVKTNVNTTLNSDGKGYKGKSDSEQIRIIANTNLISLRSLYNSEWMALFSYNDIIVLVR